MNKRKSELLGDISAASRSVGDKGIDLPAKKNPGQKKFSGPGGFKTTSGDITSNSGAEPELAGALKGHKKK